MIDPLQHLVEQLDNQPSLMEPNRLRQRLEALDRLEIYLPESHLQAAASHENPKPVPTELHQRAGAIRARLEEVNSKLYEEIRDEIRRGVHPGTLLRCADASPEIGKASCIGYDYLDELIGGVFQFEEPNDEHLQRQAEMVFYQPTPARHIFSLIGATALTPGDVFVDLGSGLGHVPLLVSICSPASSVGIELEATYVERARQCAQRLNLNRVAFLQQDARVADLSTGTVFYLYTPFTGSILSRVLGRLRTEAATRRIRICTHGPCTSTVAEERWLDAPSAQESDRVTVFSSCKP